MVTLCDERSRPRVPGPLGGATADQPDRGRDENGGQREQPAATTCEDSTTEMPSAATVAITDSMKSCRRGPRASADPAGRPASTVTAPPVAVAGPTRTLRGWVLPAPFRPTGATAGPAGM